MPHSRAFKNRVKTNKKTKKRTSLQKLISQLNGNRGIYRNYTGISLFNQFIFRSKVHLKNSAANGLPFCMKVNAMCTYDNKRKKTACKHIDISIISDAFLPMSENLDFQTILS